MVLTTHEKAKKSLAKLIKDYDRDTTKDDTRFRNSVYAFSLLLQFFKFDKEIELEKDILAIKEKLGI